VENPNPVLRADKDGALLFANPAAGPLLDNWGQRVGGALPQELQRELALALETGQVRHSERSYVSGIYSFTLTPFMDKGYVNIYAVDVTQRKSAEMALRLSELRYRELAVMLRLMCDNVPTHLGQGHGRPLPVRQQGTCEQYLDAADPQAVLGRTDEHFLRRLRAQRPDDPSWHTLRLGGGGGDPDMAPSRFEQSGANRGRFETFEVRTAPFVNDQGSIIGSVGAARSITERKAA
jgi:PAS domain-containing protein